MNNRAAIKIENDRRQFAPGEILRGRVGWQTDTAPKSAELRLFCYTEGCGTRDVIVAGTETWANPISDSLEPFEFTLPAGPYSFSGELITLKWALELVLEPTVNPERIEFTLSPDGTEIDLYRHPIPEGLEEELSAGKKFAKKFRPK